MKIKNLLMISILAIAGIFGVSSAVINKQVTEQPVAEKAEAWNKGSSIYILGLSSWSTSDTTYKIPWQKVENGKQQYSTTINLEAGAEFAFYCADGNKWWNPSVENSGTLYKNGGNNITTDVAIRVTLYFKICEDGTGDSLYWAEEELSVSASVDSSSKGSVSVSDDSVRYKSTVTLSATPKSGYEFLGWKLNGTGDTYTSTESNYEITVTSNVSYTAYFGSTTDYTIYFDGGAEHSSWSSVYLYYTDSSGVYPVAFPGTELTTTRSYNSFYGGSIYQATVPSDATTIIFSIGNNTKQTSNVVSGVGDGYTFLINTGTGGSWKSTSYQITWVDVATTTNNYVYAGVSVTMPSVTGTPTGHTSEWNTVDGGSGTGYVVGTSHTFTGAITLYRYDRINTHTITYYRNDEHTTDNTYTTDSLDYGDTSHSILAIDSNTLGWGSSYLRTFEKWNTASDGSGTSYSPGTTFTVPDSDVELYSIQRWHTYQCSADDGTHWTTLTTGSSLTGYLVQFHPVEDMELTAGTPLRFRYQPYGQSSWTEISNNDISYSGNYNSSGVSLNATGQVYLKVPNNYTEGKYECYVAGLSDITLVVYHNGNATHYGGYDPGTTDPSGYKQFRISGHVHIHKGDTIKAAFIGSNIHDLYLDNEGAGFDRGTPTTCSVSGAYEIYLKSHDNGNSWNNVYVSRDDEYSAKYYAEHFNSSLSTICTGVTGGSKGLSDIQAVWGTTSSKGLNADYQDYSSTMKDYLSGASSTSDADILACIEKYNYILNKYGTSALPNFFGRSGPYKEAISNFSPLALFGEEESLSTIIIIAASGVALLSITALSVLAIKKRKSKEQE